MATTTSTPLMTWEAFERLPDGDGMHREIIHGSCKSCLPQNQYTVSSRPGCLRPFSYCSNKDWAGYFSKAGYKLSEDPPTWIQPDASFLTMNRVPETAADQYFTRSPELAIEIISPSETAASLQHKVDLLLKSDALAVWAIYPQDRVVIVHLPDGTSFTRAAGQTLEAPFLLEGWSVEVAKLFED